MPTQLVNVTISGANPHTRQVVFNVDPSTGVGTGTLSYTGANSGLDTLVATATVNGATKTSNTALVAWQQTNGKLQLAGPVTMQMWNNMSHSSSGNYPGFNPIDPAAASLPSGAFMLSTASNYVGSATGNSLSLDSTQSAYGTANQAIAWDTLNATGSITGTTSPFPSVNQYFDLVMTGILLVPVAGTYTLQIYSAVNEMLLGIQGATYTTTTGLNGQTMTALNGYPIAVGGRQGVNDGSQIVMGKNLASGSGSPLNVPITFASAGLFPFEINWNYHDHTGRSMQVLLSGSEITPIPTAIAVPATSATPGPLTIVPSGGASNWLFQGQSITVTLTLTGATYNTSTYVPILEGTQGNLLISGGAGTTTGDFLYPPFPGGVSVDLATACTASFALSGDNAAWQGLLGLSPAANNTVLLGYNGGVLLPNVVTTNLTVQQKDIAWYNPANKSYDVYTPTVAGGGSSATVQINWLVNPVVASVSPTSLPADGGTHNLTVSLTKPLPPIQNNIQGAFSCSNGVTINSTALNTNSAGFITGWTLNVTTPTSNATATLSLNATGMATYLSGNSFTTGTVDYITGYTFPLPLSGGGGTLSQTAAPTFGLAAGTYVGTQSVTISSATSGASIYYTRDGSTATTSSTFYTGALSVSVGETISAIASASGYTDSPVTSATYAISTAAPTISPVAGSYTGTQTVTLTSAGATIYYTTDGSTPTTGSPTYSAPFTVTANETVSAIAVSSGCLPSTPLVAAYIINTGTAGFTVSTLGMTMGSTYPGSSTYRAASGPYYDTLVITAPSGPSIPPASTAPPIISVNNNGVPCTITLAYTGSPTVIGNTYSVGVELSFSGTSHYESVGGDFISYIMVANSSYSWLAVGQDDGVHNRIPFNVAP